MSKTLNVSKKKKCFKRRNNRENSNRLNDAPNSHYFSCWQFKELQRYSHVKRRCSEDISVMLSDFCNLRQDYSILFLGAALLLSLQPLQGSHTFIDTCLSVVTKERRAPRLLHAIPKM